MNYASSSSGILNHTGSRAGKCLPLSEQVGYFEKTVIACNDYTLGYLLDKEMRAKHITSYTELLIAANIERMADLGEKKFIVRGMPLISCHSPFFKVIRRQCDEMGDKIVPLYNCLLVETLDRLKLEHGILHMKIVPEKIDVRTAAAEIGSKFTYRPCCKVNEFGGCVKDSELCKNRDNYLHFDSAHLTQVYHKYAADRCFDGTGGTCKPHCINELSGK